MVDYFILCSVAYRRAAYSRSSLGSDRVKPGGDAKCEFCSDLYNELIWLKGLATPSPDLSQATGICRNLKSR